uniref:DUF3300 domain-containing protein n=1 Tax=Solibacter usitatus (strain Ellin6076) TaxID=234267 RepID=Q01WV8_SOLUE
MRATRATTILCVAILIAPHTFTFAQQQPQITEAQDQSQQSLTPGQLDSLIAPIALYPDPILSQVLVASTYPLEIVEAARWLKEHSTLKGKELTDAAATQTWDASVQTLVMLPDVLSRLNQDVSWTSELGNAFLAQQQDVMDAIQRLRQKASAAGALQSTPQQTVTTTTANDQPVIVIEPANPEVVYVPQYDPAVIWGPAPDYYPYPSLYYPTGDLSFGAGMAVGAIWGGGWNNWGWGFGWGHNNVVVNNNFINNNRFNRVNVANGNSWIHNPAHRAGVPYADRNIANRYQGVAAHPVARPTVGQTEQRLDKIPSQGGAARISPGNIGQGGGDRIGNRSVERPAASPGAFGGMDQGGARTMMNSNRGSASRGGGGAVRGGGRRR